MKLLGAAKSRWQSLGRWGQVFALSLVAMIILESVGASFLLRSIVRMVALVTGIVMMLRLLRFSIRQAIWRLRNRLLVAYVFIALVPIVLIAVLAGAAAWALSGQTAVYLVTSEFNRRLGLLNRASSSVLRAPRESRAEALRRTAGFLESTFPHVEIVVSDAQVLRHPEQATFDLPTAGFPEFSGIISKDDVLYGCIHHVDGPRQVLAAFPLTREFLQSLLPNVGEISIINFGGSEDSVKKSEQRTPRYAIQGPSAKIPDAVNRFDLEVLWGAPVQATVWDSPANTVPSLFTVHSRISAVLKVLFSQKADWDNSWALYVISVLGVLFLVVEVIAIVIGVSLSRSITGAVHDLYEGTEHIKEGDFAHRIRVKGTDQIAALSTSFNKMTASLEHLLEVAKEKERYEAELSIAREVQAQLYPRDVPASKYFKLKAFYKPARMVSGDYYDYHRLGESTMVFTIGDVSGKGISAALLMANIQSSFRTELRGIECLSTSDLVSHLNKHLYANTPPEKFSTFILGMFNETDSVLTYTNAGHLQPILVRAGAAQRLEVDGLVIGAFPFSRYGESRLQMVPDDLIVFFTDGISEPENEYGEMFGEERLEKLVMANASKTDDELIQAIMDAVLGWTGSSELQDDMTLLVARRV